MIAVAVGCLLMFVPSAVADEGDEPKAKDAPSEQETVQASKKQPKKRNRIRRAARGPDIVLVEAEDKTIYAYSQNGRLRAIKVVPKVGKPYYLRPADPTKHFGDIDRADLLLTTWVLVKF